MLKRAGHPSHIRQAAGVQNTHERLPCLQDHGRQSAALGDTACAAIHQGVVALGVSDDLADGDLDGRARQLQSTLSASGGPDKSCAPEVLNDLHQVVLGNIMGLGDLADRYQPAVARCEIDQRTKGIVGVAAQFHRT